MTEVFGTSNWWDFDWAGTWNGWDKPLETIATAQVDTDEQFVEIAAEQLNQVIPQFLRIAFDNRNVNLKSDKAKREELEATIKQLR